jgi:hypothetical protein
MTVCRESPTRSVALQASKEGSALQMQYQRICLPLALGSLLIIGEDAYAIFYV